MRIAEHLQQATTALRETSDSPRLDAELLLAHVLKQDRPQLLMNVQKNLDPNDIQKLESIILQRAHHVPIPYLTGHQEFFGTSLEVTPDVLIPRPATELLVEAVLKHLPADTTMTIADIGTGSGAIALALAKHLPHATIIASDISPAALAVAHRNATRLGLSNKITFVLGSLLQPFNQAPTTYNLQPNFVVSNLPYLTPDQMPEPSIQHEPKLALDGGEDGLDLVNQLMSELVHWPPITGLALELDPRQINSVGKQMKKMWPSYRLQEVSDGSYIRGLVAWKKNT